MSIKVASRAWDASKQSGTKLLAVIALADYANDEGIGWPGMDTLARKCRLQSRRAMQKVAAQLKAEGEIYYAPARGVGRSNLFCVVIGLESDIALKSLKQHFKMSDNDAGKFLGRIYKDSHKQFKMRPSGHASKRTQGGVSKRTQGGVSKRTQGVRPGGRPEPSLNHQSAKIKKEESSSPKQPGQIAHYAELMMMNFGIEQSVAQDLATLPHVTQPYLDGWTAHYTRHLDYKFKARQEDSVLGAGFYVDRIKRGLLADSFGNTKGAT